MAFWEKAGELFLKQRASASQNKDSLQQLTLHGINQGQQMHLAHVARGYGLDPAGFLQPYNVPASNVTINNPQAAMPPTVPQAGGFGKTLAALAAFTLAGGAGAGGMYALTSTQAQKPASVDMVPKDVKINFKLDPDNGIQPGAVEVKPAPAEPPK